MKEFLLWYDLFLSCSPEQRKKIVKMTLKAIENYSHKGEGSKDNAVGKELYNLLKSKHFRCRGVVPKIEYGKLTGNSEELGSRWVHLFGSPILLFEHAEMPVLMLVGPGIRSDKSIIQEMKMNQENWEELIEVPFVGYTG